MLLLMQMFKNRFFLVAFLSLIAIYIFFDLPKTFYQQDEWQTLGHNLSGNETFFANFNLLTILFGETRWLSKLMYLFFSGYYKFTVVPTAIFAILFQIINASLVFYLVEKITKKRLVAFIAAVFLITNSVSYQAVTWASAISSLPATTFILISILTYVEYCETDKRKYLLISLFSVIVSNYFKGVGFFLFVLFPMMFFIYKNKEINKKNIGIMLKANVLLFIFGFLTISVRFGQIFLSTQKISGYVSGIGNSDFVPTILLRSILYPLTSLFQIFVPPLDLYPIMPAITKMQYKFLISSPISGLVAESIATDMVTMLGSIAILGLLSFIAYRYKDTITNRNILFALLFFFLSLLPYVVLDRDSSYFSGRYFYVSVIPVGILFGYIVYFFVNINTYAKWATLFFVTLFLFHHASFIREEISYQVNLGSERQALLYGIKDIYPKLEKDSIFYVTSNKTYLGDTITNPFANGLGYTLEVWYYDSGNIPQEFLRENFLWDLGIEGYKSKDGKGFGYFQNIDKMADEMKKNKISKSIIHGFFFDSKTKRVIDITRETKEKLATISAIPD